MLGGGSMSSVRTDSQRGHDDPPTHRPTRPAVAALVLAVLACAPPVPEDSPTPFPPGERDEPAEPVLLTLRQVPEVVLAAPRALLAGRLAALTREIRRLREVPETVDLRGAPVDFDVAGLDRELRGIVRGLERRNEVSVHVRDLLSDFVLFDLRGDAPLKPASNNKLLTSAAALDLLGTDFRFETRALLADHTLYIVGEGDPTLDALALRTLAGDIARKVDISTLERIVVDDLAFSPRTLAPGFSDTGVGVSYQAPSGALSLEFNTVTITAVAPRGGTHVDVTVHPPSTHLVVDNQSTSIRGRSNMVIRTYAGLEQDGQARTVVELTGKLRRGIDVTVRRRISDPGLYTGGALASLLAEGTGRPPLPVTRGRAPGPDERPTLLATRESSPLRDIVDATLAWSNNFLAEQLLRTLGGRLTGEPGDWDNGAEVVLAYWQALGENPNSLVFENGSGLSDRGRLTTTALVDLIAVANRVHGPAGLVSALPVAGVEGTLRARLRRSGKRVRAKTGTMDGISGLSGVITAEDGTPQVAFSILINVREGTTTAAYKRSKAADRIVMAVLHAVDEYEVKRQTLASKRTTVTDDSPQ
jgi:D-alanyl-D-alanine carboxypeptidase/D-alanyl-D-alanine-endopeptidase (penicillin-binding protein 4)